MHRQAMSDEPSWDAACVIASCLRVCRALQPRCNVTRCRANVDVLVRHLPRDPCDRPRSAVTPPAARRRRGARRAPRSDRATKRGYSDATDFCLAYNCGLDAGLTNFDYIQCAIRHQCGLLW